MFTDWLEEQMRQRAWSQAELARRAGVTQSAISLILSGSRQPGEDVSNALAKALKIPPEEVFRAAGLLPPSRNENKKINELAHLAGELPDAELENVLEFAKHRLSIAEKKADYETKKKPRPT